jgi:hypothetical protein
VSHVSGLVPARQAEAPLRRSARLVPVVLLTVLAIAWPAEPGVTGGWSVAVLSAAITAGTLSLLEMMLRGVKRAPDQALEMTADRVIRVALTALRGIPWPEVLVAAAATLEALQPARPWHTGGLGVALLGYLFAIHLAERNAPVGSLRSQVPVIVAGLALAALAVAATALPGVPGGATAAVARIVAVAGAVFAAALVIPTWMTRD